MPLTPFFIPNPNPEAAEYSVLKSNGGVLHMSLRYFLYTVTQKLTDNLVCNYCEVL